MLGLFKKKEKIDISVEIYIKDMTDLKVRLDLIEDDIKRLRKKAKIPEIDKDQNEEDIIKSIEDDGFSEIRALHKKFGGKDQ